MFISRLVATYKLLSGLAEVAVGLGLLWYGNELAMAYRDMSLGAFGPMDDLFSRLTERLLPFFVLNRWGVIVVFLAVGIIETVGAIGMFLGRRWGQDALVIITLLALPFQGVQFVMKPSGASAMVIVLNAAVFFALINFQPRQYFERVWGRASK